MRKNDTGNNELELLKSTQSHCSIDDRFQLDCKTIGTSNGRELSIELNLAENQSNFFYCSSSFDEIHAFSTSRTIFWSIWVSFFSARITWNVFEAFFLLLNHWAICCFVLIMTLNFSCCLLVVDSTFFHSFAARFLKQQIKPQLSIEN